MRLLVGLGNPGPKYETTRHNFGFLLLDRVQEELNGDDRYEAGTLQQVPGVGRRQEYRSKELEAVTLLWPLTFMNLSGEALSSLLSTEPFQDFDTKDNILVVIDDLSLPLGRLRIRSKGSPGGHNGLKSVEAHLGHSEYSRLKLGVGRPADGQSIVDYVLEPFGSEELPVVSQVLDFAAGATLNWCKGDTVQQLSQSVNGWDALEPEGDEEEA